MKFGILLQILNEYMFFKRSPFQFAFKNSFIHKIDQDFILLSENNEEIDDYTAQDLEIMNTMEATAHFCVTVPGYLVSSKVHPGKKCQ